MVVSHKLTKTRKKINKMADQIVNRIENSLKPVVEQKADYTTEKHIDHVTEDHQKDEGGKSCDFLCFERNFPVGNVYVCCKMLS